ncbi:alpha/beta fold hydrolase [Ruegeria sp. HKCCD8929]|uniref:alpha/beta fold hydrolase n=1 Tax=Ruegeria sp. HKCCD8929 TaxID=2683006 RepID=UPI0014880718|nr:alpha/beta hydrolase [Ruegeria sp. HKCCD8929]
MPKNPLGITARMNALSLMLITPEFYRVRRLRPARASKIDHEPALFKMKPEVMQLDGLNIRIATSRKPDRPTVLFLSPLPQSILCYDAVWAQLSDDADLIAVDLPGFGRSEGGSDYMTFAAQSAFLEKFIDAMGLSDVHIAAADIAKPVAMHYVIHRNHKAKSLLVGDGPGILPSSDGSLIRKIVGSGFWRTMVRLNGARTFIAGAFQLGYLHYSPKRDEVEDYISSYAGRIDQVTKFFKQYPEGCADLTANIEKLKVPVQVFWADEDAFLNVENAHHLHKHLPDSSLHIFKNCGHFCYQDKSSEFAQMMRNWIAGGYSSIG